METLLVDPKNQHGQQVHSTCLWPFRLAHPRGRMLVRDPTRSCAWMLEPDMRIRKCECWYTFHTFRGPRQMSAHTAPVAAAACRFSRYASIQLTRVAALYKCQRRAPVAAVACAIPLCRHTTQTCRGPLPNSTGKTDWKRSQAATPPFRITPHACRGTLAFRRP